MNTCAQVNCYPHKNESSLFYAEIVSLVRNKTDFVEIGIMDIRRAQIGGILVKVSGDRLGFKPDELLRRLREYDSP